MSKTDVNQTIIQIILFVVRYIVPTIWVMAWGICFIVAVNLKRAHDNEGAWFMAKLALKILALGLFIGVCAWYMLLPDTLPR